MPKNTRTLRSHRKNNCNATRLSLGSTFLLNSIKQKPKDTATKAQVPIIHMVLCHSASVPSIAPSGKRRISLPNNRKATSATLTKKCINENPVSLPAKTNDKIPRVFVKPCRTSKAKNGESPMVKPRKPIATLRTYSFVLLCQRSHNPTAGKRNKNV